PGVELGASPRAGLMLFQAAKARAALEGRDHALPDDVQALAVPVLAHRLLLGIGASTDEREAVVRDAIARVPALWGAGAGARSTLWRAVALAAAGGVFALPVLLVPGIGLLLVIGATWVWVRLASRGTIVERPRGPASVVEGEPYP